MKSVHRLNDPSEVHTTSDWLRDVILGGQDGLVNVLGIVLGVSAANGSPHILIAASLAAAFAEAVSMGAVAYTSTLAQRDHYQKEMDREKYEVENMPEKEAEEIRKIYASKGFTGELLEKIVNKITSDKEIWVKIMMGEELNLQPVDTTAILKSSLTVGVAALIGSFVPIVPYLLLSRSQAMSISLIISTVALFFVGVYEAKTYVGSWWKNGLQLALIGMSAAFAGYFIGRLFQVQ